MLSTAIILGSNLMTMTFVYKARGLHQDHVERLEDLVYEAAEYARTVQYLRGRMSEHHSKLL